MRCCGDDGVLARPASCGAPNLGPAGPTSCSDADVVFALPHAGRAYVRVASILTPPPARFGPGHRVATPFGSATVVRHRATDERVDYVVEFPDKVLADGKLVVGYVAADDVTERAGVVFNEAQAASTAARERGNKAFKVCGGRVRGRVHAASRFAVGAAGPRATSPLPSTPSPPRHRPVARTATTASPWPRTRTRSRCCRATCRGTASC